MKKYFVLFVGLLLLGGSMLWVFRSDSKAEPLVTDPCPTARDVRAVMASTASIVSFYETPTREGDTEIHEFLGLGIYRTDGYVVTAAHVVRVQHDYPDNSLTRVAFAGASGGQASLVYYNAQDDSALLYAPDAKPKNASGFSMPVASPNSLALDTPVCMLAIKPKQNHAEYAHGEYYFNWDFGAFDSWMDDPDAVDHGSSGGAIYARVNGELTIIGIVQKKFRGNFASNVEGFDITKIFNEIKAATGIDLASP